MNKSGRNKTQGISFKVDFVKKNPEQMEEVKEISDMARTLFIILIQCSFIPADYLCLLAVLMKEHDNIIFWDNNTVSNEFYIDLLTVSSHEMKYCIKIIKKTKSPSSS